MAVTTLFERPPLSERIWLLRVLRNDMIGGLIMLVAAVAALVWANSPFSDGYRDLTTTVLGSGPLALELRVWASDGLLALFFFIAGLELKHEFVHGTLSRPAQAVVPIVAALSGMVVPAAVYLVVVRNNPEAFDGWAIPMATDIAFAVAVLAVLGRGLPLALRAFLLTLAVVDDLGAILVIALFFSKGFNVLYFLLFIGTAVAWWLLQRRSQPPAATLILLFVAGWFFIHESGVHATVAGVVFGLLTRTHVAEGEKEPPTDSYDRSLRPFVAGVAVPIFAFMAAGVDLRADGLISTLQSPITLGIIAGLVIGKPLGIVGGSWLMARFTRARLDPSLNWWDVLGIGLLAGIGFTVSLLITELAYKGTDLLANAKAGVIAASCLAAVLAALALSLRKRAHARAIAIEEADLDQNGIPDVYEMDANPIPDITKQG
jgi:Na+:H+ antiporter, NhaA family